MRTGEYTEGDHEDSPAVKKPTRQHARFARALSAAVAHRMKMEGHDCLHSLACLIPARAGIPKQTVYSCLYATTRPAVWVVYHIASALGTTLDTLTREALEIMASGEPVLTAGEVFRGAKPQGRKRGPRW